jgi:hypothetical protein
VVVGANGALSNRVQLSLDNGTSGVTGSFSPNPAPVGSSTLSLTVSSSVAPGPYSVRLTGNAGGLSSSFVLSLTVQVPPSMILVDHDASPNNGDPSAPGSASDQAFAGALNALGYSYDLIRVSPDTTSKPVDASLLQDYSAVVWYSGSTSGKGAYAMTQAEESSLETFLAFPGNREVILLSDSLIADLASFNASLSWTSAGGDPLLGQLGLMGAKANVYDGASVAVSGNTGPVSALNMNVPSPGLIASSYDALNPGSGATTLLTLNDSGCAQDSTVRSCSYAVGVASTFTLGDSTGTKKLILISFPAENVQNNGSSSFQQLLQDLLSY